jgi:hypothetical protein
VGGGVDPVSQRKNGGFLNKFTQLRTYQRLTSLGRGRETLLDGWQGIFLAQSAVKRKGLLWGAVWAGSRQVAVEAPPFPYTIGLKEG